MSNPEEFRNQETINWFDLLPMIDMIHYYQYL